MKVLLEWVKALIGAILILIVLNIFLSPTTVVNVSMQPTLVEGDMLMMLKNTEIQRGDIVTFRSALKINEADLAGVNPLRRLFVKVGDPKILIKRVIGLPGEKVEIKNGQVFINGKLIDESGYLTETTPMEISLTVPQGEYFVMGDNRGQSEDSRFEEIGTIKREDIVGKAILRYWPLSKIKTFQGEYK